MNHHYLEKKYICRERLAVLSCQTVSLIIAYHLPDVCEGGCRVGVCAYLCSYGGKLEITRDTTEDIKAYW